MFKVQSIAPQFCFVCFLMGCKNHLFVQNYLIFNLLGDYHGSVSRTRVPSPKLEETYYRKEKEEPCGNTRKFKTEHISKVIKNKFTYTWICILKKQQLQSIQEPSYEPSYTEMVLKCQWITSNKQFLGKELVSLVAQTTEASCCVPADQP